MPRLVGGVGVDHPEGAERRRGEGPVFSLRVDRGLRSGKLDVVPLAETEIIRLMTDGAVALKLLAERRAAQEPKQLPAAVARAREEARLEIVADEHFGGHLDEAQAVIETYRKARVS